MKHDKKAMHFNTLLALGVLAITLVLVTTIAVEKSQVKRPLGTAQTALLEAATHADEALLYLDAAANQAREETAREFRAQGGMQRDYEDDEYPCGELLQAPYWHKEGISCAPDFEETILDLFEASLSRTLNQHPHYAYPPLEATAQPTTTGTTIIKSLKGPTITIPFTGGGEGGFALEDKEAFPPDYPAAVTDTALSRGSRNGKSVEYVVVHYGEGWSRESDLRELQRKGASYHYEIDHDGTIYQYVPESMRANHAGCTAQKGPACQPGYNQISIGISFVNRGGPFEKCQERFQECYKDKDGKAWEGYTQAQRESFSRLVADITTRHPGLMKDGGLREEAVIGHADVDPENKVDPGPAFQDAWPSIKKAIDQQIAAPEARLPAGETEQLSQQQLSNPKPGRGYTGARLTKGVQDRVETYDPIIKRYAERYDLDPALIKAFIAHESRGVADAKSPTGALGLMQIITSYHHETRCVPQCDFSEEVKEEEYFDPEKNICCGSHLIMTLAKMDPIDWECCGQNFDKGVCIKDTYDQPYEIAARRYNTAKCEPWADPDFVESIMGLYAFYGGNPAQFRSEESGEYRARYEAAIGYEEEVPIDLAAHQGLATLAESIAQECHDDTEACVEEHVTTYNEEREELVSTACEENPLLQSFISQLASCLQRPQEQPCSISPQGTLAYPFLIKINESGAWELRNTEDEYSKRRLRSRLVLPLGAPVKASTDGGAAETELTLGFYEEDGRTMTDVWLDNQYQDKDQDKEQPLAGKRYVFSHRGGTLTYHHAGAAAIPAVEATNPLLCRQGTVLALGLEERAPPAVSDVQAHYDETLMRYMITWEPATRYEQGGPVTDITEYRVYCSLFTTPSGGDPLEEEDLSLIVKRRDDGRFPPAAYEGIRMVAPLSTCGTTPAALAAGASVTVVAVDAAGQYTTTYAPAILAPSTPLVTPLSYTTPQQPNEKIEPAGTSPLGLQGVLSATTTIP